MTIYKPNNAGGGKTKPIQYEESTNDLDESGEDIEFPIAVSDKADFVGVRRNSMRRHHVTIFKCFVLFGIFVLITVIVAGGIFFYLHYRIPTAQKPWVETCRVRYHEKKKSPHGQDAMFLMEGEFHQQVELDLVRERYEKLNVPSILNTRRALVLHDMEMGLTAVIDQDHGRCFVSKINSTLVTPISDFYNLVQSNKAGYYLPDAEIIYENYTLTVPEVDKVLKFGGKIFEECRYFDTYRVNRETGPQTVVGGDVNKEPSCPYKGERYCLGNSGAKYMLIFTITGCAA